MPGVFTISLDFELHWGGFEKWELGNTKYVARSTSKIPTTSNQQPATIYNQYFLNTRKVIPQLLASFEQYKVHVTWATVGMLFHQSKEELFENAPTLKPSYLNHKLSAYNYIDQLGIGENEHEDPFHFAPSLIRQIVGTPHQEIGTHTFAHYYCNEAGQTVEQFSADLQAAQRVAKQYGCALKSLVFPRNQFNDQYLKACYAEGITSVRSNPLDWFWHIESTQDESRWKRFNRGMDAYFPIGKKKSFEISSLEVRDDFPVCIPASRLLRPYRSKEFFLNKIKMSRIKSEMTRAAQQNEVYHLWWHPHNFGHYPHENMKALQQILTYFKYLNNKYGMESYSMSEIADLIRGSEKSIQRTGS